MALVKLKDVYPDQNKDDKDAVHFDSFHVYTSADEKIGSVKDVLIDEQEGLFRYLIVDIGPWIFGKTVLLPLGLTRFDYDAERVYVDGLTKGQVENLPEFTSDLKIDQDYEERVRGVYRPLAGSSSATGTALYNRDTYRYEQDPGLYTRAADPEGQRLSLYEKQLMARRNRTPQ